MAVTSVEQVNQIIRQYDAAHYECPTDRRRNRSEPISPCSTAAPRMLSAPWIICARNPGKAQ